MSICIQCGLFLASSEALCPHHVQAYGDNWAVGNRIWCDFFHRGIVRPTLPGPDPDPISVEEYVPF